MNPVTNDESIRTGGEVSQWMARFGWFDYLPRGNEVFEDVLGYCIDRPMVMPAGSVTTNCTGQVITSCCLTDPSVFPDPI